MSSVMLAEGGVRETVESALPDFELKDGTLWVEQTIQYSDYNVCLWIDTETMAAEEVQEIDLLAFDKALVMGKEHMLLKTDGEVVRSTYEELGLGNWDREKFLDAYLPYIEMGFWGFLLLGIWSIGLSFFAGVLILAMIGSFLASVMGCRLPFGDLMRLAVHAKTLPTILKGALAYVPVVIPFFTLISLGISIWYMRAGIRSVKAAVNMPENKG